MSDSRELISALTLEECDVLRNAIRVLDDNPRYGIAIIASKEKKYLGILTNGDVYRAIFAGHSLETPLKEVCNRNAVTLRTEDLTDPHTVREATRHLLEREGMYIPIIDSNGQVTRVAHYEEFGGEWVKDPSRVCGIHRVLIMGGAGYLGSGLTQLLLAKGYRVRILDNFIHHNYAIYDLPCYETMEIRHGDIRDLRVVVSSLEDVRSVILLAAVVGDPASKNNPKQTIETNYLASKMIAEACKVACVSRLVFASTCSVYGIGNGMLDESSPLNPVSLYARTKISAEQAILSLGSSQFSPTVLRLGTLYGLSPRMRFDLVVNLFALNAVQNGYIEVYGGSQWRPLVHIDDAANAFMNVLEAPCDAVSAQVFNVGLEEQNLQIRALADIILEVFPSTKIDVNKGAEDCRDYKVSFEKARKVLNFAPTHTIADAVREIGAYLQKQPGVDFRGSIFSNQFLQY